MPWSIRDILLANVTSTGTLLDVGCGNGGKLVELAPHFDCIIALDPDKAALACTRQTLRRRSVRNVKVCAGLWQALPVRDASVDVVTSMFSGVHAAQAHRVLKPGGLLVVECIGPPEGAAHGDPQSATMEFAATLYTALHRYFPEVSIRHALWPHETQPAELTGDAFVAWGGPREVFAAPVITAGATTPRMRFIAVCRKTG